MNEIARAVTMVSLAWMVYYYFNKQWYSTLAGHLFPHDVKGGTPYVAFGVPLFLAGSITCLLLLMRIPAAARQKYHPRTTAISSLPHQLPARMQVWIHAMRYCYKHRILDDVLCRGGDWNMNAIAGIFVLIPSLYYLLAKIHQAISIEDDADRVGEIANGFGLAALVVLSSFLLIPVPRQNPLTMASFGTSHVNMIRIHIWSGRIVVVGAVFHGLLYFYQWRVIYGEGIVRLLIPPVQCWTFHSKSTLCQDHDDSEREGCSCSERFRNLTGFLACLAFVIVALTSNNIVRRSLYGVFYKIHTLTAPFGLLLVILHWKRSIVYMAGGVLFYLATTVPTRIENWFLVNRDGGVKIRSIERILCLDRPCVALTIEASEGAVSRYCPGQYIRLFCPALSSSVIPHPFTVNTVPGHANQLRIIFRVVGPFTQQLSMALIRKETLPIIGLDGFHGTRHRLQQTLQHDTVVFVAGGIGITPYLTLLHRLHSQLCLGQGACVTKLVILHWIYREEALAEYISQHYWKPLLERATSDVSSGFKLQLIMHSTSHNDRNEGNYSTDRSADQDSLIVFDAETGNGVPFRTSHFIPASCYTLRGNLPLFMTFVSISGTGMILVWFSYRKLQNPDSMISRLISPIVILLVTGSLALIMNMLHRSSFFHSHDAESLLWATAAIECKDVELAELKESNGSNDPAFRELPPAVDQDDGTCTPVTLERHQGRPTIDSLVGVLKTGQHPGLFVCGPDTLARDLCIVTGHSWDPRRWVQRQDQVSRVSLYNESFYM